MIECVGGSGYAATTVATVTATARVSRSAFYAQFADKDDCFRAAYRGLTQALLEELATIGADQPTVVEGTRASVGTYLRWCRERPGAARFWHLAVLALEPDGPLLREESVARIARIFAAGAKRARREHVGLPVVRPFMFDAAIHATLALIAGPIREGDPAGLDELAEPLLYLWLVALADHAVAGAASRTNPSALA